MFSNKYTLLTNDFINEESPLRSDFNLFSQEEVDYTLNYEDNDMTLNEFFRDSYPYEIDKQKTSSITYLAKKIKRPDNLENISIDNNIFPEKDKNSNENLENINKNENPLHKEEKIINENNILENKNKIFENLPKINLNELSEKDTINIGKIQIEIKKEIEDNNNNNKINKVTKYGRKTDKEKKNGNNGKHTKKDKDNQMRKIKSFFGKSIYRYLKNSFIEETDLLKLEIDINKSLKRDFNLDLFKRTLKDIYMKTNISYKYKLKNVETNEALINKIYKEKKEIEIMKILNLTYGEAFEIFRQKLTLKPLSTQLKNKIQGINILNKERFNNVEIFLKKIREEEKKKGENKKDIEEYLEDIKSLVIGFEDWFLNKIGRERD